MKDGCEDSVEEGGRLNLDHTITWLVRRCAGNSLKAWEGSCIEAGRPTQGRQLWWERVRAVGGSTRAGRVQRSARQQGRPTEQERAGVSWHPL